VDFKENIPELRHLCTCDEGHAAEECPPTAQAVNKEIPPVVSPLYLL